MNPEELRDALERRAETAGLTPSSVAEVQRRARGIGRRRTAAAVTGAATAVALIAGLGVALAPGFDDHGAPAPATRAPHPVTSTPTPSTPSSTAPSASTPARPSSSSHSAPLPTSAKRFRVPLDPNAGQTYGGAITIPNWINGMLVAGDGSRQRRVDRKVYNAVADTVGGDWFGITTLRGRLTWTAIDGAGASIDLGEARSDLVAVTPDGQAWAVILKAKGQWVLREYHPRRRDWPLGSDVQPGSGPVGFLPDGRIVLATGRGQVKIAATDGSISALPGDYVATTSASAATGAIVVQTSSVTADHPTACWAVVNADGRRSASTCDWKLHSFSADGRLIWATRDDAGSTTGEVALLDATTLQPQAVFVPPSGGHFEMTYAAWDGSSLLTPVYADGSYRLAWLSEAGVKLTRSLVTPGAAGDPPYLFGAGPLKAP